MVSQYGVDGGCHLLYEKIELTHAVVVTAVYVVAEITCDYGYIVFESFDPFYERGEELWVQVEMQIAEV